MSFYAVAKVIVTPIFKLLYGQRVVNKKGFPTDRQVIVASNHTSFIDPILIGMASKPRLYFMAKAEIFRFKPFGALIRSLGAFPVHRGARDNDATNRVYEIIGEGKTFALFPQGKRMPRREDPEDGKPGVAMFSDKTGVGVLPVYIYNKKGKVRAFSRNVVVIGDVVPASFFSVEGGSMIDYRRKSKEFMEILFALKERVPEKWK